MTRRDPGLWRLLKRVAAAGCVAAASLGTSASSAAASLTIGQLAPGASPPAICNIPLTDAFNPTVGSGNSYVIPGTGTITSWSTNVAGTGGTMDQTLKMKIFRKVGDPAFYTVVGHDGFRSLANGLVNTFSTSIAVTQGDVLGLNSGPDAATHPNACGFNAPGGSTLERNGDLGDGEQAAFNPSFGGDFRSNVTAVFVPSNVLSLGPTARNKKRGTATITLEVPNPGELTASGKGVKAASAGPAVTSKSVSAGRTQLLIKAKGKKKQKLAATGRVKLNVKITYTPTGGDQRVQPVKVKLVKR